MIGKAKKNKMTLAGEVFGVPALSPAAGAINWSLQHKKALLAVGLLVLALLWLVAWPHEQAEANPLVLAGKVLLGAAGVLGLTSAGGAVIDQIRDALGAACNGLLSLIYQLIYGFAGGHVDADGNVTGIFANFDQLVGANSYVYQGWIEPIHEGLINTAGIAIMCVCLVIGLAKVLQQAGNTEAGVNGWQLFLPFILFTAGVILVTYSIPLMQFPYDLMKNVAESIGTSAGDGLGGQAGGLTEGLNIIPFIDEDNIGNFSAGLLLQMILILFLVLVVTAVVYVISNVVLILRGIQLYAYTALAPISLAFIVSDSSRSMATGFAKRYLAVVLSFLMMYVLFGILVYAITGLCMDVATVSWGSSPEDAANAVITAEMNLFMLVGVVVAFGFAVFKSGSWSKELLGI